MPLEADEMKNAEALAEMGANLLSLPILLPVVSAIVLFAWGAPSRSRRVFAGVALTMSFGATLLLMRESFAVGPPVLRMGGFMAPYGIVLIGDKLSTLLLALSAGLALLVMAQGFAEARPEDEHPLRLPLLFFLLAGLSLAFTTGDLFNLFVSFEVLLLASYGLLTLELRQGEIPRALPYLTINLVASALFVATCAFTYGLFGTLNFAELSARASLMGDDPRLLILGVLFIVVFGIKAGIFPFYYLLPTGYPLLPASIAAFFAGMLTKLGVYILLRIFGGVLPGGLDSLHTALAWIGAFTMILGGLSAVAEMRIKTILAYHIASQIGYMALAIGLFTEAAFAAAIFFLIHNIVVKSGLFLVSGVIEKEMGTDDLSAIRGLARRSPWLAASFLILALSLAGIPPLSGFFGKLMIVRAGLEIDAFALVALSLIASFITLASMLKIYLYAFMRPISASEAHEDDDELPSDGPSPDAPLSAPAQTMLRRLIPIVLAALALGPFAEPALRASVEAADQLLDQDAYRRLILIEANQPMEGKAP